MNEAAGEAKVSTAHEPGHRSRPTSRTIAGAAGSSSGNRTRVLQSLALGLLLAGSLTAACWMAAELYVLRVRNSLNGWEADTATLTLADWNQQQTRLERAALLTPPSAEQLRLRGMLFEWRQLVTDSPLTTADAIAGAREEAITAYRQSAWLRPAWPAGWAYLARQKALAGQQDDELLAALDRMHLLGPEEPEVHLITTQVATLSWPFLEMHPDHLDLVIGSLEYSLYTVDTELTLQHLLYILEQNMQEPICSWLDMLKVSDWTFEACTGQLDEADLLPAAAEVSE